MCGDALLMERALTGHVRCSRPFSLNIKVEITPFHTFEDSSSKITFGGLNFKNQKFKYLNTYFLCLIKY